MIEDPILLVIHNMVSENESSNLILGDYAHALLHLVTLQQADKPSRLIFGLIEAFPTEIDPTPFSLVLQTLRCSGHRQFACIRQNLPMAQALELYFKAMETAHITWPWSATHDSASTIAAPHLVAWTRWPNFLLSDTQNLPCIAPRWGKVRTHSLLAKDAEAVARLISDDNPAAWLGERLRFDLPGEWRELVGSLHLILPNPLYRRLQLRLLPATGDTAEAVRLGFIPRAGQAHELESTLTVQLSEHRHTGITNHRIDVSTNPMTIDLAGFAEQVGLQIDCRRRGLLDEHPLASFIRQIQLESHLSEGRQVTVVQDAEGGERSRLAVDRQRLANAFVIHGQERATPEQELWPTLRAAQGRRARQSKARHLGQYLCRNEADAKNYVRALIRQARTRIVLIDPYFDDRTLVEFALQTQTIGLPLTIWTAAKTLQKQAKTQATLTTIPRSGKSPVIQCWQRMQEILAEMSQPTWTGDHRIDLMVMTGKHAVFHDRLLLVDGAVWFSGNSLNDIGRRRGLILQVPDPMPILAEVERLSADGQRVCPFAHWVRQRDVTIKGGTEPDVKT